MTSYKTHQFTNHMHTKTLSLIFTYTPANLLAARRREGDTSSLTICSTCMFRCRRSRDVNTRCSRRWGQCRTKTEEPHSCRTNTHEKNSTIKSCPGHPTKYYNLLCGPCGNAFTFVKNSFQ